MTAHVQLLLREVEVCSLCFIFPGIWTSNLQQQVHCSHLRLPSLNDPVLFVALFIPTVSHSKWEYIGLGMMRAYKRDSEERVAWVDVCVWGGRPDSAEWTVSDTDSWKWVKNTHLHLEPRRQSEPINSKP